MVRILAVSVVLTVLTLVGTGCWLRDEPATVAQEPQMLLRTYQVPVGYEDEARVVLRNALAVGDKWQGSVSVGPSGSVVVVAPQAIQTGIAAFVEQLKSASPGARGPQPVALDYWILVGRRAGAGRPAAGLPRREGSGFAVLGHDALPALDAALSQVVAKQGGTDFTLLEHLRVASVGDEFGSNTGRRSRVDQRAAVAGSDVVAEIRIKLERTPHQLQTRVVLKRGQVLVLAESGFTGEPPDAFASAEPDDLTLYYVVAADLPA
jgi:hypothetical protein